jgi:hypothetical protein
MMSATNRWTRSLPYSGRTRTLPKPFCTGRASRYRALATTMPLTFRSTSSPTATKPTFGPRAVARQWANAKRKLDLAVSARRLILNGETAIVIHLKEMPAVVVAVVHLETRGGQVLALRINRDPRRTAQIVPLLS